ncbi:MAG: hypothetical protein AAB360_03865, partial [Patescibacteria group bacterium]
TWDGGGADSNWATAANWSADTAPVVGDDVVFNSTSYNGAYGASDTVTDDLNSITMTGLNWNGAGNNIRTAVADTTNHFIYYGTYESPARIIKVNGTNNQIVSVLTLDSTDEYAIDSAINITNGYAYFGMYGGTGKVVKIQLSDFTRIGSYSLPAFLSALTISSDGAYVFAARYAAPAMIYKIQTSDMTLVGSALTLASGENYAFSAISDGTYAYFGTTTSHIAKVQMSDNTEVGTAFAYAGPGTRFHTAATDGTYGYFGTYYGNPTDRSDVIKIQLSNMTQIGSTLTLNAGETNLESAAIDTVNGFVYFGTEAEPGKVVKVATAGLTRSSVVTLNSGENRAYGLAIDSGNIFIGTYASPPRSVLVNLTSFTRTGVAQMGYSLYLQKHAISSSGTGTANNYRWDLETMTVNSGYVVAEGDTTVNPADDNGVVLNPLPPGCGNPTPVCGRGMIFNANDITIASGAKISADGKGFTEGTGPGYGTTSYSGGAYGGDAGYTTSNTPSANSTYGSPTVPLSIGSGGRNCDNGASGGGSIKMAASGTLTLNGTISANGGTTTVSNCGGGSGGSVYISAANLSGSGSITADGGSGSTSNAAGGGGGRIAVALTSGTTFGTVSMTAYGGTETGTFLTTGGAGTVVKKIPSQTYGELIVDNNDQFSEYIRIKTPIPANQTWQFDVITVDDAGELIVPSGATLTIGANTVLSNSSGTTTGYITNRGTVSVPSDFTVSKCTFNADPGGTFSGLTNLTVASGAVLAHSDNTTTETYKLDLTVSGNLTVDGSISVFGLGYNGRNPPYTGQNGPGGATASYGAGSYGGVGGFSPGPVYGSSTVPVNIGSGAGNSSPDGGSGGGAIKLAVTGTLILNGTISANGGDGAARAGGSGGSVYIVTNTITGSGTISANGGNAAAGGGGGGGRMAIYYKSSESYVEGDGTVGSNVTALGGTGVGYSNGVAGTRVIQHMPSTTLSSFSSPESQSPTITFS